MKRFLILSLVLFFCVGCDQITKYTAKQFLPSNSMISFGGDTVRLQYVENTGAFLSLGAELPADIRYLVFTVGVSMILAALSS